MVVKDIPANATAVGIPARVVDEDQKKASGISPYAVGIDDDDPMSEVLQKHVDKLDKQERRIKELESKKTSPKKT